MHDILFWWEERQYANKQIIRIILEIIHVIYKDEEPAVPPKSWEDLESESMSALWGRAAVGPETLWVLGDRTGQDRTA